MMSEVMEVEELPCVIERFAELWEEMDVKEKIDDLVRSDYSLYVVGRSKKEVEGYEFDYWAAMKEFWWYPLADAMSEGCLELGELWDYRGATVMLVSLPTSHYDKCWLQDGRLVSTIGLIEDYALDWLDS
jgi:hypothetical protein